MIQGLIGKKVGMTQVFADDGRIVPVTVIQAGPCAVTQLRTTATDGYSAVQLAFEDVRPRRSTIPVMGHDAAAGVTPKRIHRELRLGDDDAAGAY